jgi:hypothetical protein
MKKQNKEGKVDRRYQVPTERWRWSAFAILIMPFLLVYCSKQKARADEGDGYYGILNANPALIDSVSQPSTKWPTHDDVHPQNAYLAHTNEFLR